MPEKVKDALKQKDPAKYAQLAESLISDDITSLDVAAALLKMLFASQKKEEDAKADVFGSLASGSLISRSSASGNFAQGRLSCENTGAKESGMTRLFINIGKKDNVRPGDFVGAIAGETGLAGNLIGNIKILEAFSFVEVPNDHADNIINALNSSNIKGKRVSVEPAKKTEKR